MQWLPGHRLKNRPYEIEQELGEGGFGITYKARNLTLDISVVIKTPNRKLQRDGNYQKYVENFTREAKQLAQLGLNPHPHIVRVTDLFEEDRLPCIIMDFIPGQSLYDLVWSQGKLSEAQAVEYIRQIGSALSVCHEAGIVHRDVHPNNILIRADNGRAVLIDFGISGTTQTSRNTHSGNRAFAPWEQMAYWEQEDSKTPQVDVYTLAASLYYLVTGQEPTECLARKYNNSELIEPQQLNLELSDSVNRAILKGVEVDPENRPSSMPEWLDLLSVSLTTAPAELSSSLPSIANRQVRRDKQIEEVIDRKSDNLSRKERDNLQPQIIDKTADLYDVRAEIANEKTQSDSENFNLVKDANLATENFLATLEKSKKSPSSKPKSKYAYLIAGASFLTLLFSVGIYLNNQNSFREVSSPDTPDITATPPIPDLPDTIEKSQPQEIKFKSIAILNDSSDSIAVESVAFSPDDLTLASGGYNGVIKLWNVATQQQIATLTGHLDSINSVAYSPDGKTLASCSHDGIIKLWNLSTQQEISSLQGQKYAGSVIFSPDGKTLASININGDTIKLWDVATKTEIANFSIDKVTSIAFSPDGKTLASSTYGGQVKLWDVVAKQEIAILFGHSDAVWSVAFSPDGKTLASGSFDRTIKLWDWENKRELMTLEGYPSDMKFLEIKSVVFSPDGKTLMSLRGRPAVGKIQFWDIATGAEIPVNSFTTGGSTSLSLSSDGKTLASSSRNKIHLLSWY